MACVTEELGLGGLGSLMGKLQHLEAQPVYNRVEQGSGLVKWIVAYIKIKRQGSYIEQRDEPI